MKKRFVLPEMEVVFTQIADVITTSGDGEWSPPSGED